jgi:hypothetical protein
MPIIPSTVNILPPMKNIATIILAHPVTKKLKVNDPTIKPIIVIIEKNVTNIPK